MLECCRYNDWLCFTHVTSAYRGMIQVHLRTLGRRITFLAIRFAFDGHEMLRQNRLMAGL